MEQHSLIGFHNLSFINIHENFEVEYWAKQFNINPQALREVAEKAGTSVDAIAQYLKN